MTTREMIDSLSSTLLCDERILSVPERDLLANLLQRTRTPVSAPGNAVAEAITRLVGEIIAERALGVLGDSMTQQLLRQRLAESLSFSNRSSPVIRAGSPPFTPPSPSPGENQPQPRPPGTTPPPISFATATAPPKTGGIAVLESPESAPCVVLDEFLTLAELNALRQYVLEQELRFEISEVVSPGVTGGAVDYEHRRSRVLMDLGNHEKVMVDHILGCLPGVLEKWERAPFPISRIEIQTTASNHHDFFRCHNDNGAEAVRTREVTFVYFFHGEPKRFSGGALRIYDSRRENDNYVPTANYRTIVPEQNQVVLFTSGLSHEITPVECPSGTFADSRFTVNGWVHS
jgi:SM-20-related protein